MPYPCPAERTTAVRYSLLRPWQPQLPRRKAQVRALPAVQAPLNLLPTLTALENITLPMDIAGRKPDKQWLDNVITMIGLKDRLHHRPTALSGGQQQRVAIARALASRPEIIFGDEPTGNLDSRAGAEVLGFMRNSVRELDQTVVMVTHDPVAASYANRVIFLADGRIVDEMLDPSADGVLDRMKAFDSKGRTS
ncbi:MULTISPECIES: ABC transporter ATP-binding protein [unclassified Streptomyces]|uniref:ABC transporter ATP-binding protein n=1 Tax=unclassified Streptomyces TaxID=2593676 RepID=UPI0027E44B81|nr:MULTISPECIES: ABC transporter ATP-binding protein [unclassified Streptomyces]